MTKEEAKKMGATYYIDSIDGLSYWKKRRKSWSWLYLANGNWFVGSLDEFEILKSLKPL